MPHATHCAEVQLVGLLNKLTLSMGVDLELVSTRSWSSAMAV